MHPVIHEVAPEIVQLIEQTVRSAMSHYPLRTVKVRAGEDHDGDPVIFVEAEYDLVAEPIELTGTLDLLTSVNDKLWERREQRFAHIRHMFHERQRFKFPRRSKA